jgi:anthranilate phosphoribosyltransferase
MSEEHPFAQYVRILARGKTKSRPLTRAEAEAAMAMIVAGEVLPEQLGAFLMLLRFKEETAEEIAGFVAAARAAVELPEGAPSVDLDWSSYAGKRRQLPWFILSAWLLAGNGIRVFMHGAEGHTPGRLYTRPALEALGVGAQSSLAEAARAIEDRGFAYLGLEHISPPMHELIGLRPVLGLRSPAHTISRMLNPFAAPCSLQGIFHPGFMETHRSAGRLIGQPHLAVFRGEGGEVERRPNKPTEVWSVHDGVEGGEKWAAMLDDPQQQVDEEMDVQRLGALWRGTDDDAYGRAAVIGTAAIALKLLGKADSQDAAEALARDMWEARDIARLGLAA